ncbi:NAD(P)H-dependent oxidoreductase [Leptospira alstonii]|uniref:Nitroreductase family protein n=2 Tax=Leptospira alstonii TaxID=28452 RepID=M6CPS1_9LEPT|nr:NAD(P)H-dependent oxidoreductase [Leptospira alstonii]EMJ93744.1 nitroreductase family protein [Leptospira alstonii serovar Sichuan str. 79601]EQA79123.1 nitroreductase family protein [Leptospira alstonii serovar Pingchang str. 80-412]
MDLLEKLNWRYATKRMTGRKLPREKLERILESLRLTPSGFGLQPYKVLVIEDEDLKSRILPIAFNQPQILESSHILVFAAWDKVTEDKIREHIQLIANTRNVSTEALQGFQDSILGWLKTHTEETSFHWAARQAYIALGTGVVAAAVEGVDATPMEGFNPAALDELLQLKEKGLRSTSILALGYRDVEKDGIVNAPKVRKAKEDFLIHYSSAAV